MSNADDGADEVKVFRRQVDDSEEQTPESSEQIDAEKKDAAKEEELEHPSFAAGLIGKAGAFQPALPSPSFVPAGLGFPMLQSFQSPLSPAYPNIFNMMMPQMMPGFLQQQAALSPSFFMAAALSPHYAQMLATQRIQHMMNSSPGSALANGFNQKMNVGPVPLAPNMRNMNMQNLRQPFANPGHSQQTAAQKKAREDRKRSHIKKPLNAFMWYMKENRPKLMEELGFREKQSAELNKELGQRWHRLSKDDQEKYFTMAKQDKANHQLQYPNWSARENYAIHKKKKRKIEKTEDLNETKKCRARFGLTNQSQWCAFCKRKKKCQYAGGVGEEMTSRSSSSTEPSLHGDDGHHLMASEDDDEMKPPFLSTHPGAMQMPGVPPMSDDSDNDELDEDMEDDDPTLTSTLLEGVNTDMLRP